jgi:hypothetical protein
MSDTFSKVEVITGVARRRRFSTEPKPTVAAEILQPGMSISCCPPSRAITEPGVPVATADEVACPV